jgi:RimJ/RimL family protein N-acetyltransferase
MTRIRIEPLTLEDADAILGLRPERLPWAEGYPTDGDVRVAGRLQSGEWRAASDEQPFGAWLVVEVDDDAHATAIGGVGFHGPPDASGEAEIGYGIAQSRRRRGHATEAVGLIRAVAAAHGVRRLVAGTDPDNLASQRVLVANGFRATAPIEGPSAGEVELRWALDLAP